MAVELVVDAGEGLELAADIRFQLGLVECERAVAGVDDVKDGASALAGRVAL